MQVITTSQQVADFCAGLEKHAFVTIDTEFLREKTYFPKLCLVQLSGGDKDAAAIDPLAKDIDLSPLFALLVNPNVLKVFHAGRQDMEIFYNLTGKIVAPVFDTQIAAMVCGYGDSIGYEGLVRSIVGAHVDKSSQFTDWSVRPLSERQIKYALGDVIHLCDVYVALSKELEERGRSAWVTEEEKILSNPKTYENDPYKTWERIKIRSPKPKSLAILREITAWREKAAQKRDIPRTWVMKDETLTEIAHHAPRDKAQLKKIRNVSNDMAEGKVGEQVLQAIETALESPKESWPQPQHKDPIPSSATAILDVLKMLLKVQSTEHGVAAKLIASSEDLETLVLDEKADVPILKGWRYEIFGKEAMDLKAGKLAIGLKDGKITKFRIADL